MASSDILDGCIAEDDGAEKILIGDWITDQVQRKETPVFKSFSRFRDLHSQL